MFWIKAFDVSRVSSAFCQTICCNEIGFLMKHYEKVFESFR